MLYHGGISWMREAGWRAALSPCELTLAILINPHHAGPLPAPCLKPSPFQFLCLEQSHLPPPLSQSLPPGCFLLPRESQLLQRSPPTKPSQMPLSSYSKKLSSMFQGHMVIVPIYGVLCDNLMCEHHVPLLSGAESISTS